MHGKYEFVQCDRRKRENSEDECVTQVFFFFFINVYVCVFFLHVPVLLECASNFASIRESTIVL